MVPVTSGVALVGHPGGQPGNQARRADPLAENVGGKEVLLHEPAERGGKLVLALDDQRRMRYRQAQRAAEEGRDREPVGNASDHGSLRAGLHVAEQNPVGTDRGHDREQNRYPREESGGPAPRGG